MSGTYVTWNSRANVWLEKLTDWFIDLRSRIYEILPQRIQQWQQSPCIAEEQGKKQLERIRREQQAARMRLAEMERRFHELEGIIAKAKQQVVQQDEDVSIHWCFFVSLEWCVIIRSLVCTLEVFFY